MAHATLNYGDNIMARRTTVGAVTGAVIDSMQVVSDVAGMVTDGVGHLRVTVDALGHKAIAFREQSKLEMQRDLGSMKTAIKLDAKVTLAKQKAEIKRMMDADADMATFWEEASSEVDAWFN